MASREARMYEASMVSCLTVTQSLSNFKEVEMKDYTQLISIDDCIERQEPIPWTSESVGVSHGGDVIW